MTIAARSTTAAQVRQLFNPRSIALIGATDKSRWSWSIFGNLQLHGFAGPVYLVNPRGIPVHGQRELRPAWPTCPGRSTSPS